MKAMWYFSIIFIDGSENRNQWESDEQLTDGYPTSRNCQTNQRKLVSGSQSFILGAVIHTTNKILPYQNAMVQNYLQVFFRPGKARLLSYETEK